MEGPRKIRRPVRVEWIEWEEELQEPSLRSCRALEIMQRTLDFCSACGRKPLDGFEHGMMCCDLCFKIISLAANGDPWQVIQEVRKEEKRPVKRE